MALQPRQYLELRVQIGVVRSMTEAMTEAIRAELDCLEEMLNEIRVADKRETDAPPHAHHPPGPEEDDEDEEESTEATKPEVDHLPFSTELPPPLSRAQMEAARKRMAKQEKQEPTDPKKELHQRHQKGLVDRFIQSNQWGESADHE